MVENVPDGFDKHTQDSIKIHRFCVKHIAVSRLKRACERVRLPIILGQPPLTTQVP